MSLPVINYKYRDSVVLIVVALIAATALLSSSMRPAAAAGFSNPASIPIGPDVLSSPTSALAVAGEGTSTLDVNVTLNNFSHTNPREVDVLLEGPTGVRVMLLSDVGCNPANAVNLTLTFDDAAPGTVPVDAALLGGTYKPTDNDLAPSCANNGDAGVPTETATTLSAFNGTNPNGTWKLYVADDTVGDGGQIAGGWTLSIQSAPTGTCGTLPATIEGTSGNDVIFGTAGNDVIVANGGDDVVRGLGGDDYICGGDGNDKLKGGAGKDRMFGEAGRDKLNGGGSKDFCFGGAEKDAIGCEKAKQN